jgi:hypothetical protein
MMLSWLRALVLSLVLAPLATLSGQTPSKPLSSPAKPPAAKRQKAAPATNLGDPNPFDRFKTFTAVLNGGIGLDHDRKVYRLGNSIRADFDDSYRVTDVQTLKAWGGGPRGCQRLPFADASSYPFSAYHGFKIQRTPSEEKETVDGHACRIEHVTFTPNDERPMVIKMKLWEAEDLDGFPIRIEVEATGRKLPTINYTNVSLAPPDAKLFERPAHCKVGAAPGQKGSLGFTPGQDAPKAPQKAPPPK